MTPKFSSDLEISSSSYFDKCLDCPLNGETSMLKVI